MLGECERIVSETVARLACCLRVAPVGDRMLGGGDCGSDPFLDVFWKKQELYRLLAVRYFNYGSICFVWICLHCFKDWNFFRDRENTASSLLQDHYLDSSWRTGNSLVSIFKMDGTYSKVIRTSAFSILFPPRTGSVRFLTGTFCLLLGTIKYTQVTVWQNSNIKTYLYDLQPWTLDSSISEENRAVIEKMLLEEEYPFAKLLVCFPVWQ